MTLFSPDVPAEPPSLETELAQVMPVDAAAEVFVLDTPRSPKPLLSLGCAWLLEEPVNVEVMDQERLDAFAMQHAALAHGLPADSLVQCLMLVLPSTQAPRWHQRRAGMPPTALFEVQRAHLATGVPHVVGTRRAQLREFRTLVTLRCPLPESMGDVATLIKTVFTLPSLSPRACHAFVEAQLQTAVPDFTRAQRHVENILRGCGHVLQRLNVTAFGEQLATFVDPLGKAPTILPEYPLRSQVLTQNAQSIPGGWGYGVWHREDDTFEERYRAQVLSLNKLPLQTCPGLLSAPRLPRDSADAEPLALWDIWEGPLLLAINMPVLDQAQQDAALEWAGRIARFQKKFSVRNRKIAKAINKVMASRFMKQTAMGGARVHVVLWGEAASVTLGLKEVQDAAARFKLAFLDEPDLGKTLWLQCLPLGCNPTYPPEWALKRLRKFELPNLLDLFPLFGAFRGTATATHFAVNQRGEEVGYDLFDTHTNPHRVTIGTSGAGKTYNTAKEISEALSVGDVVLLLDPLANYRALCAFWAGKYVRLNFETPPRINPFYGPLDLAHRAFVAANLNEMAGNASERLTWTGFNVLSDALGHFAEAWQGGEPTISDFVTQVLATGAFTTDAESQTLGREIARRLMLYYGRGIHAKFVDGPNTFEFGDNLTVIEFQQLDKAKKLQAVLFFGLMHLLRLKTQSPAWRGRRKHIKADELWAFLDYEETAEVFNTMILTGRNDGLSIDFMTQLALHLESPVGKVIRGIVEKVLFLQQDASEFPSIARTFNLTQDEQALFARVKNQGRWNSGYLRMNSRPGGIMRIFGDPVLHLLMTQEPSLRAERERLLDAHPGEEHAAIWAWLRQKGVLADA